MYMCLYRHRVKQLIIIQKDDSYNFQLNFAPDIFSLTAIPHHLRTHVVHFTIQYAYAQFTEYFTVYSPKTFFLLPTFDVRLS